MKRQFVLVATSAVFAVLVLVLMLVNRMNYLSLYESSMDTLELITYYGGALPGRVGNAEEDVELPRAARYFSVSCDSASGEMTPVLSLDGMSTETVYELSVLALHAPKDKGVLRTDGRQFFYSRRSGEDKILLCFLNNADFCRLLKKKH